MTINVLVEETFPDGSVEQRFRGSHGSYIVEKWNREKVNLFAFNGKEGEDLILSLTALIEEMHESPLQFAPVERQNSNSRND